MFGLFKSKKDKKAEQLVKELREVIHKQYSGNVVYELGSILQSRYKLTISTYETIRTAGLLPGLNGSGSIAVAISKNEILFIAFRPDIQKTEVQLAIFPEEMLEMIKKNLISDNKIAKHREGTGYTDKSDITIFIGALTLLGHEVGIPREDRNSFPLKYKNNNFILLRHEEKLWIAYEN